MVSNITHLVFGDMFYCMMHSVACWLCLGAGCLKIIRLNNQPWKQYNSWLNVSLLAEDIGFRVAFLLHAHLVYVLKQWITPSPVWIWQLKVAIRDWLCKITPITSSFVFLAPMFLPLTLLSYVMLMD